MSKSYPILFFIAFVPSFCHAQFEGSVSYDVTYHAMDENKKEMLSMLPKESSLYVKGKRSLFEQEVAGGGRQSFLIDSDKGSGILIMQFIGQAYKVEMTEDEIKTLKKPKELDFLTSEETKTISGYVCNKIQAISGSDTLDVFYSIDLKTESAFPPFEDIEGLPLQYELIRGGVKMKYTAVEVKRSVLDESIFDSNPDLKSIKFADFAKSFAISQ